MTAKAKSFYIVLSVAYKLLIKYKWFTRLEAEEPMKDSP